MRLHIFDDVCVAAADFKKKNFLLKFENGLLVLKSRVLTIRPWTFLRNTDAVKLISPFL